MEAKESEQGATFPHVVTKRSGKATIYRTEQVKNGRTYVTFRVVTYGSDGKRVMAYFADFREALRDANSKLDALGRGLVDTTVLAGPHRLDYLTAIKILDGKASLTDAANAWVRKQAKEAAVTPVPVRDAVDAFIATRESAIRWGRPASEAYKKDLRRRLTKFADTFKCDLADVTANGIEQWLASTEQTGRNRFNSLRLIRTFMRWAQKRGNLPPGDLVTDRLEITKPVHDGAIEIFTPGELHRLLTAAKPEMRPYVALGAFAGCRTAEIARLGWRDIYRIPGFIEVAADKAKTASRRLVPILPALAAWLQPVRHDSGPVLPFASLGKQVAWLARDAGVEWKINALRHSFISYRLAVVQDAAKVALEAGNSPTMIFSNYRELVTPEQGTAWFNVLPDTAPNVVTMPSADETKGAVIAS